MILMIVGREKLHGGAAKAIHGDGDYANRKWEVE